MVALAMIQWFYYGSKQVLSTPTKIKTHMTPSENKRNRKALKETPSIQFGAEEGHPRCRVQPFNLLPWLNQQNQPPKNVTHSTTGHSFGLRTAEQSSLRESSLSRAHSAASRWSLICCKNGVQIRSARLKSGHALALVLALSISVLKQLKQIAEDYAKLVP